MALLSFWLAALSPAALSPSPAPRRLDPRLSFSRAEAVAGLSTLATQHQQPPLSLILSPAAAPLQSIPLFQVYCGRGDKKTKKGKRFRHSYGNARPRNSKKGRGPPRIPIPSNPQREEDLLEVDEVVVDDDDDDDEEIEIAGSDDKPPSS